MVHGDTRIEFRRIAKRFAAKGRGAGEVLAVRNVSFAIGDGEVVSLIGPSGCGKSTLLNMGAGLYRPTEGEVFVAGRPVQGPSRQVAFMLQKDLLLPWRTIVQNVELGLEIQGASPAARHSRARALLDRCHLSGFENYHPHQLSGGMRQRAALARTLAVDPAVLLLDEPFSALDAQTKMVLQQDLAQMLAAERKTALFITHDLVESIVLSDRVLVMSARPGTITEELRIELPERDDPIRRGARPEVARYLARLMGLLRVGDRAAADEI